MQAILKRLEAVSVYDLMIFFLVILGIAAGIYINGYLTGATFFLIVTPLITGILDIIINIFIHKKSFEIPKTAIISGLFIAGILDPHASLMVHGLAALLAILSKHILRMKKRNIFNPAAFGIVLVTLISKFLLHMPLVGSWWMSATLLTIPFGLYISYRMEKLPLTLSFYIVYSVLAFLLLKLPATAVLDLGFIAGYFFFASFMLLEPRTSPYSMKGMVISGVLVAVISVLLPFLMPAAEFTLIGILVMNTLKDPLDKVK